METSTINLTRTRSETYQVLSALFCQPEAEIFKDERIFHKLRESLKYIQPNSARLADNLIDNFSNYSIQELLVDYTRIFLGPFNVIAYPYSSVYYGEKQLMTNVTTWVENYYRMCGLSFDYSIKDLPDHIVVELEFMYHLTYKNWEAQSEGKEEEAAKYLGFQKEFITKHLANWGVQLSNAIIKSEENTYYSAVALCLKAFLLHEKLSFESSQN